MRPCQVFASPAAVESRVEDTVKAPADLEGDGCYVHIHQPVTSLAC